MSTEMREHAAQERWDEVAAVEVHRRELLETFFAQAVSPEEADEVAAGIEQILAIDREVMTRGEEERALLVERIKGVAAGQKAQKAYSDSGIK